MNGGRLTATHASPAADPHIVDPIASALGADLPTWHDPEMPTERYVASAGAAAAAMPTPAPAAPAPAAAPALAPDATPDEPDPADPADRDERMPLDALITGRIATLGGTSGLGWVEAIGNRDGRVAFAGSEVALETRADPFTRRFALEPDEVAIPGLTDAHLHLAQAAHALRQVDLSAVATLAHGMAVRSGSAYVALADPDSWP